MHATMYATTEGATQRDEIVVCGKAGSLTLGPVPGFVQPEQR